MRIFSHSLAIALCGLSALISTAALAQSLYTDELKRGEYLAHASDCDACHTAPAGKPLAGGLEMATPVGTIYSTNITPSKNHGIGAYSEQQFADALRKGLRGDGTHLYPAMPYTSFALMSDEDIHALYGYFMNVVAPVDETSARTNLPFPYNMRFSMAIWNALFLKGETFKPDAAQSAEWNRGKYLTEGPAHCSVCHSPRGLLLEESQSERFSGAVLGSWYAPNVTSDPVSGIGALSVDELAHYLKTGKLHDRAQAAGDMGLAVEKSFQNLTDADIRAIAVYMKSTPPVHNFEDEKPRFDYGAAVTSLGLFRGSDATQSDNVYPGGGAQLFIGNCATCHGVEAQGTKDGYFPSLFHNSALAAGDGRNLLATILFGVNRRNSQNWAFMPAFGGKAQDIAALSDDQIAQIANYVFKTYGNPKISVTPDLVKQVREGKGPPPPLVALVNIGEWVAGFLVLGLLIFVFWRRGAKQSKKSAS